jgi:streptogramin lyase
MVKYIATLTSYILLAFQLVIVSESHAAMFVSTFDGILEYNETTGNVKTLTTYQSLWYQSQWTYGITTNKDGNIFVGSATTSSVFEIDGYTGKINDSFVPSGSGGLYAPHGVTFGPDGNLYVTGLSQSTTNLGGILRYDGTTGAFIDTFVPAGSGGLGSPYGITFGPDGNLYVSGMSGNILRFNGKTGAFIDTFVPFGSGGLNTSFDIAFGPDGNLYATNWYGDDVLRFDGKTGDFLDVFVPPGSNGMAYPMGLAFGKDNNLYVANYGRVVDGINFGGNILKYDLRGKYLVTISMPNNARPCYLTSYGSTTGSGSSPSNSPPHVPLGHPVIPLMTAASVAAYGILKCRR